MEKKSKIIKRDQVDEYISLEARLNIDEFQESKKTIDKKVISKSELSDHQKAGDIIKKAREDATLIKNKAKEIFLQVEEKMAQAKKEGFEQGRQEGLATVTEELAKIEQNHKDFLESIEKESIGLVYEIAKKIMGDNLKTSDEALVGMVRHALQSSMGDQLTLYVHPSDYERIKDKESQLMSVLQASQTLSIKATENVQESGCVIESELGTIDAQLDYQLQAIKKALGV